MYELTVHTTFNATHALRMPDGSTEPVHGHDWRITAAVAAAELTEHDWVIDFHALQAALRSITQPLHHTHLNDHEAIGAGNATAELVARYIAGALGARLPAEVSLLCVSVTEAPGCVATYRPT